MWDTTKDYRILVASKARENYLNLIPTASFRGSWNKKQAIELGKQMNSDFQSLTYSYLEGDELVNSPDVEALREKALKIIEYLGGDDWNKKFLNNAPKDEREKTQENIEKNPVTEEKKEEEKTQERRGMAAFFSRFVSGRKMESR